MNLNRLKLLKKPELSQLGTDVESHIESWLVSSTPSDVAGLLDDTCLEVLSRTFHRVGGSEGTVWLAKPDGTALVAVFNSGSHAKDILGFEQPMGSGIISMVYAQQQPYCENEICPESGHDDTLDRRTSLPTRAMVAIPFYFAFGLRGVISCVQLKAEGQPEPSGFKGSHVEDVVKAGNRVERLVNGKLLSLVLGFDEH